MVTVGGAEVGEIVGGWVGIWVFVGVTEGTWLARGGSLGSRVCVDSGTTLLTGGWNGVRVGLAFGSTVTRLRGGEDALGVVAYVQEISKNKPQSTLIARRVRSVILLGCGEVSSDQV